MLPRRTFKRYYSDAIAVWLLASVIIALVALYFTFTVQTVTNVVTYEQFEEKTAMLSAEISRLEFKYIEKKNSVDLAVSDQFNMSQEEQAVYINRPVLGARDTQGQSRL